MSEERDFESLARDLDRLESITEQWNPEQRATAAALRSTVEALQVGAFRRLIRTVKDEPGGLAALAKATEDPWVRGVLSFNGLIRGPAPDPTTLAEGALDSVRPMLAQHGGTVRLVEASKEEVKIELGGSCDGCSQSDVTVRQGIETALREAIPTLERVKVINPKSSEALVKLRGLSEDRESPFSSGGPWEEAGRLDELSEGKIRAVELEGASVILTLSGGVPKAYRNACSHLGMPLDTGEVSGGVLTCPFHGFQFRLSTGECLTAPEVGLPAFPLRLEGDRIFVQVVT